MPEWNESQIEPLLRRLSSEDSLDRLSAIEELSTLTRRTFGFRFNDSPDRREAAVRQFQEWWKEKRRRKEQQKRLDAAIHLSGGMLDLGALKKVLKEIPPQKIQGYLNALIQKMKAQQEAPCESCHSRPATVSVTEIHAGGHKTRHVCDLCAREQGDILV